MSERLRQFVVDMSADPARAKRLTADPTATLDEYGLSAEEKQVVLTRNPDAIREATGLAASDPMSLNAFLETPPAKPAVRKPRKPRPRKPSVRKPARKAPAKKRSTKRSPAPKRGSRKTPRKTTRKSARKGPRRRR